MDFRNEGLNMLKMQEVLDASEFFDSSEIVIPKPFMQLSSRSDTEPPAACFMRSSCCAQAVQYQVWQCCTMPAQYAQVMRLVAHVLLCCGGHYTSGA